MRQASFDSKFKAGAWRLRGDGRLARVVEQYSSGGLVVVLGCGSCGIARELKPDSYSAIHGLDFSPEAVRIAQTQNFSNCNVEIGDMAEFSTDERPTVIVFPESIYYLKNARRRALLNRITTQVAPGGVIIATIADPRRYAKLIDEVRRFTMVEDRPLNSEGRWLLVFR